MRPFHFLADARAITSGPELIEKARRAESIGFHALVVPDHLIPQLAPVPTLAWIAQATDRLRIGSFVHNNDLRHPAVLAQDLATLDVLSGGRLDVAIGAGWNRPEYDAAGIPFEPTPVRQARLAEAVAILKGAFGEAPFSFSGSFYTITGLDGQPKPVQKPHPPFLIGGGGRRTLELAGREAQIVGLAPRILPNGPSDPRSYTLAATAEKIGWAKAAAAAAGRDPEALEFNVYPSGTAISVTDDPRAELRELAGALLARTGVEITVDELLEAPSIFVGSIDGLVEKFEMLRERLGISSFMVGEIDELGPLVERLAGR